MHANNLNLSLSRSLSLSLSLSLSRARAHALALADKMTASFELNLEFVAFSGCADMAYNSTAPDDSWGNPRSNARVRPYDAV